MGRQYQTQSPRGGPAGQANHVVHLGLPAGAQAACALNAGVEVDGDGRVRVIGLWLLTRRKARRADIEFFRPAGEFIIQGIGLLWHITQQQFEHQLLRFTRTGIVCVHHHAGAWFADTTGREYALAFNFDNTGTAVAIGAQTVGVAQVGNFCTQALGRFENCFTRQCFYTVAVEGKGDRFQIG